MEQHNRSKEKPSKKKINRNSAVYIRQREKANARKRRFLDKMTPEQREIKKAKDRDYYQRKKAEKKIKFISDMSEREKRQQRKLWKKNSRKYRERKKMLASVQNDTPPDSDIENEDPVRGRNPVNKGRSKLYRTIRKQKEKIGSMQRKLDSLRKRIDRNTKRAEKEATKTTTPMKTVNDLLEGCYVTPEVRKRLLFGEAMVSQLKENSDRLPRNSKEKEVFQKCLSGTQLKKYRVSHMANKFLSRNRENSNILTSDRKPPTFHITKQMRHKIHNFFERDDVSRMCPGKKDCFKNGKPRRLLLDTVKNLYPKFVTETGIKLSYATLLREKPSWVMWPKNKDRDTCLCVKHENFEFKLEKLYRLGELKFKSTSELIKAYSCDVDSYDCMYGLCNTCGEIEIESRDNGDTVAYFEWQVCTEERVIKGNTKTIKLTKKTSITTTVKELKIKLLHEIADMKKHCYGISENLKEKRRLKENLNDQEILIQIDFAENYMTKYGKEIQSTHFGASKGQLTIHTGVFYARKDNEVQTTSFATVSDNLDHQAYAVWGHLKPMLQNILNKRESITTLHIFSDGPTSQYRNRTNIYLWLKTLIDHFPQITSATWNYSEPGHGKGPMDGVGAVLKRTADDNVLKGKDVKTATEFVSLFEKSTILLQEITGDAIDAVKDSVPNGLDAIPGIMHVTKITWKKDSYNMISLYRHSKLLKHIKLKAFTTEEEQVAPSPPHSDYECMKTPEASVYPSISQRQSIYRAVYGSSDSSSSSDDENLQTLSNRLHGIETDDNVGTSYGQNKENVHPNMICPETFLLINLPTEKGNTQYKYVAIAKTGVDEDGEVKVTYLSCLHNSAKMFKIDHSAVYDVSYEQIMKVLPTPQLEKKGRRSYYRFDTDIDIFEK